MGEEWVRNIAVGFLQASGRMHLLYYGRCDRGPLFQVALNVLSICCHIRHARPIQPLIGPSTRFRPLMILCGRFVGLPSISQIAHVRVRGFTLSTDVMCDVHCAPGTLPPLL